jgi:hypothetical protein
MADTTQGVAFQEALRGVTQQQAVLNDIRARASTVLGAASISTSFLGGLALDNKQGPQGWSWLPVIAFAAVGLLTIYVLLPKAGWTFRFSAKALIRDYVEAEPPAELAEMQRDLALHLENHYERNELRLNRLFWLLRIASALLVGEVVLWLVLLRGN